jgi:hypothetical protein
MHIFVMAENTTISVQTELDSEALQSKQSSENINVPTVVASNNYRQDVTLKNSSKDASNNHKESISASNRDEDNTESKAEKVDTKFTAEQNIDPKIQEKDALDEAYGECKGHLSCVERRMVTLIDRLDTVKSIPIFEGFITIEKTSEEVADEAVVEDPDVALLSRVDRFLGSHAIRVRIPDTEGDIPVLSGRVWHEKFLDFNLRTLVTNDASEGK